MDWRVALIAAVVYMIITGLGGLLFAIQPDFAESLLIMIATVITYEFCKVASG